MGCLYARCMCVGGGGGGGGGRCYVRNQLHTIMRALGRPHQSKCKSYKLIGAG